MARLPAPSYSRMSEHSLRVAEALCRQGMSQRQPTQTPVPSKPGRSPLSAAATELLTELYRVVAPRLTAPGCRVDPLRLMTAVHGVELNENIRQPRDQYLRVLMSAMDELEEAKPEWLTPELQALQRWFEPSPKHPSCAKAIELRINEALRESGEPELGFYYILDFLDRSIVPPAITAKPADRVQAEERQLVELLARLRSSKPRLHRSIAGMLREFEHYVTTGN